MEIRHYVTASGRDLFQEWLDDLGDLKGRVIIQRRIDRILKGNLGDHKFCEDGVWELRIDFGPVTGCTMLKTQPPLSFYSVVDQSDRNRLISSKRSVTGWTIRGGKDDSQIKV